MNKLVLCILDGWGCGIKSSHNAVFMARKPYYDYLINTFPNSILETSGECVGLPAGQMGNSEVGHLTIGAGRVIFQDFPRINKAIESEEIYQTPELLRAIEKLKQNKRTFHLIGLISDGGIHGHINHLIALAKFIRSEGIEIKLHAILDGRDSAPKSATKYLKMLADNNLFPTTISGRYFIMDRDKRWERIKLAYDAIIMGQGKPFTDPVKTLEDHYSKGITDEFIEPHYNTGYIGVQNDDAILVTNYRADRARQICNAIANPIFKEFPTKKINYSSKLMMSSYSKELEEFYEVMFKHEHPNNTLGEVIAKARIKQLRIAETEKYAHVTYFFNGGKEEALVDEERILIPSPKVATYDLKPEMSALEITEKLCSALSENKFGFVCVNFANADMVGHTGVIDATITAVETIDKCLEKLHTYCKQNDYELLITSDHGNAEEMLDNANHQPLTSHTTNPVPLIYVGDKKINLKDGSLSDIAPTILKLMGIKQPEEITGKSLF